MDLTRQIDPSTLAALSGVFFPILMVYADWPGAPVYAHSGAGSIFWGGETWVGVGALGGVDIPAEAISGVVSAEAILSLVGVPVDLDGRLDDAIRGRTVAVYFAVLSGRPGGYDGQQVSGEGVTIVGSPVPLFFGTMDAFDLDTSATQSGVSHEARVTVTTGPSARSMATIYHTDEDQRKRHPGDTAGRLLIMAYAKAQKLTWPEN